MTTKHSHRQRRPPKQAPSEGVHLSTLVRSGIIQTFGGQPASDPRVTAVEIIDNASDVECGALVLGVGIDEDEAISSVAQLSEHDPAALVLREAAATERVEKAAARAGLPLALLRDEVSWTIAFRTLHSLISEGVSNELEELIYESDDLTQLAKALATRIENPLTIENTRGEVLAYSAHGSDIDPARQKTILTRKSPAEVLEKLRRAGVFRRIDASAEPVRLDDDGFEISSRIAMAIREGNRSLGYIWVMEVGAALGPEKMALLRQAARLAASYMIRQRLEHDLARRIKGDLIREIIRSEIVSLSRIATRASSVGLSMQTPFEVVVVEADSPGENVDDVSELEAQAEKHRLFEMVSFEGAAIDPDAVCASMADSVISLLPAKRSGRPVAPELAYNVLRAAEMARLRVSIGIGTIARDLTHLPGSYRHAEQAVRVARRVYGANTVMAYENLGVYKALGESEGLAERGILSQPVEALARHDSLHGTSYSRTLEVFLDEFGDRAKTARILKVHHNTLAYRLKRIEEIAPIDLSDAEARLAAQLEFRAIRLRPKGPTPA